MVNTQKNKNLVRPELDNQAQSHLYVIKQTPKPLCLMTKKYQKTHLFQVHLKPSWQLEG